MTEIAPASQAPAKPNTRDLEGQVALVTGASRGLGYATALHLAARGAHVIAVARSKGGLEELDDQIKALASSATLVPFNLRHTDKIANLGPAIYERWDRLDILVGAAATLGPLSPLGHIPTGQLDEVFAINTWANVHLIRMADPLLRRSPAGRVVMVTCAAAHATLAYWGLYGASKAALEAFTLAYAGETRNSPVRVNLYDPGAFESHLRAKAFPGIEAGQLPSPVVAAQAMAGLLDKDTAHHGERVVRPGA